MRDIKFRVWDKFEKRIYKVEEIRWNCFKEIELISVYENDSLCKSYVKNHNVERHNIKALELMKYTGLKDKNGKEIYEGDIVEYDDVLWTIEYSKEDGAFILNSYDILENFRNTDSKWVEVIGNIYENPNLLQEEN